ncbi:DUF6266 family protein [Odoribacter lunatus]|uniref:DUF6266 family protein n=1 Tax=Odoribacter lunatus TaxID=2941335 RepID=UPI00203AD07E|nr:DUF6266 family protein [Odoribacter lunatus]
MATFDETSVNRNVRKSIGNITYSQQGGQNIAKSKITRNSSNSEKQRIQRLRWCKKDDIVSIFADAIEIGFPERPRSHSSYNAFVKANMATITVDEELNTNVKFEEILCTKGKLRTPEVAVALDKTDRKLTFTPETLERFSKRSAATDKLYAMIVEKSLQTGILTELGCREEAKATDVSVSLRWNLEEIAVYVFAVSADGRKASNSLHVVVA